MAVGYKHPRGTRASLDALATSSGLEIGQVYVITDEDRLAVATDVDTYSTFLKEGEGGASGWTEITSVTPGAVASVTVSDLDLTPYNDLLVVYEELSHTNGAAAAGYIYYGDGTNFSAAQTLIGAVAGTVLSSGSRLIPNFRANFGSSMGSSAAPATSPGALGASSFVAHIWKVTGGIKTLKFGWQNGVYDGGVIRILGQ